MNKIVEKANKMDKFNNNIPDLEIWDIVTLAKVWDGEGQSPLDYTYSCSYKLTDTDYINYEFKVLEANENELETKIEITDISMI